MRKRDGRSYKITFATNPAMRLAIVVSTNLYKETVTVYMIALQHCLRLVPRS